jgi:O-antigen/teichoic acid export membrane protein
MRDVARRAALLSLTRVANQALMLLSPVILVRLLSVPDFGRYREFIVYCSVMQGFGGAVINGSLTSFVPASPEHTWQFVRQTVALVAATSLAAVVVLFVADMTFDGALVGPYLWPVALYTLFFVNFDFWQSLWIAQRKLAKLMAYTTARLVLRITVVCTAAALTHDVMVVIWSSVALEAARALVAAISWLRQSWAAREAPGSSWREMIAFSAPLGLSTIIASLNTRAGSIVVAKHGGPSALAEFSIGTYMEPIVIVLRNSLSEVLLPDLVRARAKGEGDPIALWKRATVVFMLLMVPAAILIARHAESIVLLLFSKDYLNAVPVMQVFTIFLLRECFDFGVLLRAANRTLAFFHNSALSLAINGLGLVLLVPVLGIVGAAAALVLMRIWEAFFLGSRVTRIYSIRARDLLPWRQIGRVILAAGLSALVLVIPTPEGPWRWPFVVGSSAVFCAAFWGLLLLLRVPEVAAILATMRRLVRPKTA